MLEVRHSEVPRSHQRDEESRVDSRKTFARFPCFAPNNGFAQDEAASNRLTPATILVSQTAQG